MSEEGVDHLYRTTNVNDEEGGMTRVQRAWPVAVLLAVLVVLTACAAAAMAATPVLSSSTSIFVGTGNPVVVVTVGGDTFGSTSNVQRTSNWTFGAGTTGLSVKNVTKLNANQAAVTYSGTARAGTLSILGRRAVFTSNSNNSNTLNLTVGGQTAGVISTISTIAGGNSNPSIAVDLAGDTFTAGVSNAANWNISGLPAGLTVSTIVGNTSTKATITFTGANTAAGTISVQAKAAALARAHDSNTFTLAVSAPVAILYTVPNDDGPHLATWLAWPHDYQYPGEEKLGDAAFTAMTKALVAGEKVRILAYNSSEQTRITNLLTAAGVPLTNVQFYIVPTNDYWIRDYGPVFAKDANGAKVILDWGFNGWGLDQPYNLNDTVPARIGALIGVPVVSPVIPGTSTPIVLEGGAIEHDGTVGQATISSMFTQRNPPTFTRPMMADALKRYEGITAMNWLDGAYDPAADITDDHIDGHVRFVYGKMVTMSQADLATWGCSQADIARIYNTVAPDGRLYSVANGNMVILPITAANVTGTSWPGSYVNLYAANACVIVPIYGDSMDSTALSALRAAFPGKNVVGVNFAKIYSEGGMTHCVTMPEPQ